LASYFYHNPATNSIVAYYAFFFLLCPETTLGTNFKSDGADFLINPPADFITCQKPIPDYFNNCVLPKDVVDIKK